MFARHSRSDKEGLTNSGDKVIDRPTNVEDQHHRAVVHRSCCRQTLIGKRKAAGIHKQRQCRQPVAPPVSMQQLIRTTTQSIIDPETNRMVVRLAASIPVCVKATRQSSEQEARYLEPRFSVADGGCKVGGGPLDERVSPHSEEWPQVQAQTSLLARARHQLRVAE